MAQRHAGNVLNRFEHAGFTVVGCKMARLTPALLRTHNAHVADKPFYPEIEQFAWADRFAQGREGDYSR